MFRAAAVPMGHEKDDRRDRARGLALMLLSAFLFGVLGFLIKRIGPEFRVWDIAVYRFVGGFLVLLAVFGPRENLFRPTNLPLMLIRGLTGTAAFITLVLAIQKVSLSTAMILFYSYPAFSALLAPVLFGDRVGVSDLVWIVLAFAGVIVLADARLAGTLAGQAMGVVSALFAGLTVTIIRKLRETHSPVIIYFFFCMIGGAICLGPFLADPRLPQTGAQWAMVAGILTTSVTAQLLMNQGFRYCTSWQGGMFMTTEVIYASVFGIFLLGESVTWRFWVGGALVVGSSLASQLRIMPSGAPDAAAPRR